MKSNLIIGIMTIIWLLLMVNIIWQGTGGRWYIEDAEKIGKLEIAQYTNQIMVVAVSEEGATLCLYEKEENGIWESVLETEALIGENGLGKKKEGDKKTPVGTFCFTKAFGTSSNPGTKIEYIQVDESHYWVDDATSKYYNQLVSTDVVVPEWTSAEHICEYETAYRYVLATSYNSECIPGAGSAVFLHCTSEDAKSTAGCIAVPEIYMKNILKALKPECVLIIDTAENILNY